VPGGEGEAEPAQPAVMNRVAGVGVIVQTGEVALPLFDDLSAGAQEDFDPLV
jgi:hypothetical protein